MWQVESIQWNVNLRRNFIVRELKIFRGEELTWRSMFKIPVGHRRLTNKSSDDSHEGVFMRDVLIHAHGMGSIDFSAMIPDDREHRPTSPCSRR